MYIKFDENTRVKIAQNNYILQYRRDSTKGKTKGTKIWVVDGYFGNLAQCANEAINNAPREDMGTTGDFKRLLEVIQTAEKRILKAINNP